MNTQINLEKEETYEESLKNIMKEQNVDITKYNKTLKNDLVFKIFFSRKGNEKYLISFLEAILNIKIKKVEVIPEASLGFTKIGEKWSRIDIKASVDNEKVVNIEMQLEPDKEMVQRSTYYGGRLIAEQLEPNELYSDIKQVILINILNFNLLKTEEYHTETVTVEKNNRDYEVINNVKYHFIELPKFRKQVGKINTKLEGWLAIIDSKDWGLIQMAQEVDKIFEDAIMEIEAIINNKQLREIINRRHDAMREEASALAYAKEKGLKLGIEEGMKEGIKEGKKEGKKEGIQEEKEKIAKEMLKDNVDIETIMKFTKLSKEDITKL